MLFDFYPNSEQDVFILREEKIFDQVHGQIQFQVRTQFYVAIDQLGKCFVRSLVILPDAHELTSDDWVRTIDSTGLKDCILRFSVDHSLVEREQITSMHIRLGFSACNKSLFDRI